MMEFVAERSDRLDRELMLRIPGVTRSRLATFIAEGGVTVNGEVVRKAGFALKAGMTVTVAAIEERAPQALEPVAMALDVRYEDEALLVVNKARGLMVHPSGGSTAPTLVHGLLAHADTLSAGTAAYRPGIVHRLDKETTGLLVVAKTDAAHAHLAGQIKEKTAVRRYLCVAKGVPDQREFVIDAPLGKDPKRPLTRMVRADGKPARTRVQLLGHGQGRSLLVVQLETGRTHQIRVHLAAVGLPVVGDHLYATPDVMQGPLQLHAAYIEIVHPLTGERLAVFAEPPSDFVTPVPVDEVAVRAAWREA